MWRILTIFILIFLLSALKVQAIYDPVSVPNNRFGMHIIDENDLVDTAKLINSTNGDWGYVKLVITQDDRKLEKWQDIFDRMRKLHLIPIIRLATRVENGVWIKPSEQDIGSWVDFLNNLNWVTQNRYVIIFNEPNHAKEWGGNINPGEYGKFLKEFSVKLKEKSPDFFILPAGLDASAPSEGETLDEAVFLQQLVAGNPDIFSAIDGWTSHSYPNPNFSGNVQASGRGTVKTYQWELNFIKNLGAPALPVFIAETGWRHSSGKNDERYGLSPEVVAQNYQLAFQNAWNDPKIVSVTPFLLNYQDVPFDHFSWKKFASNEFYPMYETVQLLTKITGQPKQHLSADILTEKFPDTLVTNSDYTLKIDIKNTGQAYIDKNEGWTLRLEGLPKTFQVLTNNLEMTGPFHLTQLEIKMKTPKEGGIYLVTFALKKGDIVVSKQEKSLTLIAPPSILVSAKTWINRLAQGSDFQLLFYDEAEKLVEKRDLEFNRGLAEVDNLYNIVPNQNYRLVLTKPYYLPRQVLIKLTENKMQVSFSKLLPLDPSRDGSFNFSDIQAFFKRPLETIGLFISL